MSEPQTDVSRPSALPTATLLHRTIPQAIIDQNSDEYLDNIEEEWNKKVDLEVETLVDGMVDLVGLASVRGTSLFFEGWFKQTHYRSAIKISFELLRNPSKHRPVRNRWQVDIVPGTFSSSSYFPSSLRQVRAANTLISITHSMKLLLLLSDEAQIAHRRDAELKVVQEEKAKAKEQVAVLLDELLRGATN
ncbi:hypothetical protein GGU10DRAFT_5305 [Lentinula aff. detonsa]|uniref:Uncharacterized protein n=1 Tax=Lentinula aff. detonsa TaxID=2804958 RepID=A0AA38KEH7_9AGAR|nr:hypothetical protein GGU10DRAFT_5305 [Lentinula aff. detonsa]